MRARDRALLRAHRSARIAASSTSSTRTTRSSTSGSRGTTASPASTGPSSAASIWPARRAAACSRRRSVLTVSSYATRTSPVLRGKWILDNLLNAPPPDPPADVPEPRRGDDRHGGVAARAAGGAPQGSRPAPRATAGWIRSASASRTSTPSAPGGRWTASSRSTPPGTLPDGRQFNGPEELRRILVDRAPRLRALPHLEAADLRARPRPRALRPRTVRRSPTGCRPATTGSRRWSSRSSTACRSRSDAAEQRHDRSPADTCRAGRS